MLSKETLKEARLVGYIFVGLTVFTFVLARFIFWLDRQEKADHANPDNCVSDEHVLPGRASVRWMCKRWCSNVAHTCERDGLILRCTCKTTAP